MGPRGIENNMKALSDAGIRVAAISVDKPEKTLLWACYILCVASSAKKETSRFNSTG